MPPITEGIFSDLSEPQKGHGTFLFLSPNTSSSYIFPHVPQRYSNMGIATCSCHDTVLVF
jgi:hypothetical protein